jgi:hypothetical protein
VCREIASRPGLNGILVQLFGHSSGYFVPEVCSGTRITR